MKTLFIVPNNDAEALKIQEILKREGKKEGEDFVITNQQWGASWDKLEKRNKGKNNGLRKSLWNRTER
jgi:hypothetical protein